MPYINPHTYKLTLEFNANGSGVTNLPSTQTRTKTSTSTPVTVYVSIPLNVPQRTGYAFNGYARSSAGEVVRQPGDTVAETFTGSYDQSRTSVLYCIWSLQTYTIAYEPNGGSGEPADQIKTYGTPITLSETVPTRSGYSFLEWNTAQDGTGASYSPGDEYSAEADAVLYAQWKLSVTPPVFTTQPSSQTVIRGDSATVSCLATADLGTVTYQWQSSPDNNEWGNIVGASSNTYSAPTGSVVTIYYRCVASSTYAGYSEKTNSVSCFVTVNSTPLPIITSQPNSETVIVGQSTVISTYATGNSVSYQWQYSTDGGSYTNILGAVNPSFSPDTSTAGTTYYRCIVTNALNGYTASSNTADATVSVESLKPPTFTKQPISASYAAGATAAALESNATSNGSLTYQWQSSLDGETWANISGASSQSYTPPTGQAGTKYYKCMVTATGGSQTEVAYSNVATIRVVSSTAPVFTYDLSQIDVSYDAGDVASSINGIATVTNGTITYQWQKSADGGYTWFPISGATAPTYSPPTNIGGSSHYRVVATNYVGTSTATSVSGAAKVTINNVVLSYGEKWSQYINSVGKPFVKLARLDFLNPNGSVLFSLDNNPHNPKSSAFIQDGEISVNLQNGQRRMATVVLSNLDGEFDYNVNKLWFGQQVQLWEGIVLPSGNEFYISQGVFYVMDPIEVYDPGLKQTTLNLVDKWAYLDGTLFGNLDGTYEVPINSNIFNAIQSVLNFDRGNGQKVDSAPPVFTNYYNGKTTTLPDGTTAPLINTPYTYRCDSEEGTYADIVLELNTMLAGWIGYDSNGQLRLDPSQDDIIDTTKPVLWNFSPKNSTFLGATYSVKNSEVYNDIIIVGESLSEYGQTAGRATNYDPRSDTNANIIGLKTKRYQQSGYYTQDICESLAVFKLKRESVLKKSVSISCSQLFHLQENNLVTVERTDKPGNPIERHLITGYTRPIAQSGKMVLNCTAVSDFPVATVSTAS